MLQRYTLLRSTNTNLDKKNTERSVWIFYLLDFRFYLKLVKYVISRKVTNANILIPISLLSDGANL